MYNSWSNISQYCVNDRNKEIYFTKDNEIGKYLFLKCTT